MSEAHGASKHGHAGEEWKSKLGKKLGHDAEACGRCEMDVGFLFSGRPRAVWHLLHKREASLEGFAPWDDCDDDRTCRDVNKGIQTMVYINDLKSKHEEVEHTEREREREGRERKVKEK